MKSINYLSLRFSPTICFMFLAWSLFTESAAANQADEAWVRYYDHNAGISRDEAVKVKTDSSGNILVAGNTDDGSNGVVAIVLKYSNEGVPLWTNFFSSGASSTNIISDLAVDGNGNVLLVGTSDANGAATIKYSSAGLSLWTNYYQGSSDIAHALAVTTNNDVIVTGQSIGSGSGYDQFVIQYSSAGTPMWTNRFNGDLNGDDAGRALVIDAEGNIIVTGGSVGSSGGWDWLTIKYSNSGVPLWTNVHESGEDRVFMNTFANKLSVNSTGETFVTGRSFFGLEIIKYSVGGVPAWTNLLPLNFNAFFSVTADGNDDVILGGRSGNGLGALLIRKFAGSTGSTLWTKAYSTGYMGDFAVDNDNNVIATGEWQNSIFTVKLSGSGDVLSTNHYYSTGAEFGHALAVDTDGNYFVAGFSDETGSGESGHDFVVIKYALPTNLPPVSTGFGAATIQDQPLQIAASNLLAAVTDPEDDAISLVSVATSSTNGAAITQTNNLITYAPVTSFVGADSFNYVVADIHGATNTVAAQIAVLPSGTIIQSISTPSVSPGDVSFNFSGNPGETWMIERATELSGPWTNVAVLVIQADGTATYQDSNPPEASGYYRAMKP